MPTDCQVINYVTPITQVHNINNKTTQTFDYVISFHVVLDSSRSSGTNEREGIIRKPSPAKPYMLETFKPKLPALIPELQLLTDKKLYDMLEEDDDDE
jgi:hypothetical protein